MSLLIDLDYYPHLHDQPLKMALLEAVFCVIRTCRRMAVIRSTRIGEAGSNSRTNHRVSEAVSIRYAGL